MKAVILQADAAKLPLENESVDLVFGSPPYTDCRTYDDGTLPPGHVVSRGTAEWVEWMLGVTTEALRVCRGPVLWVVGCPTRDRTYQPAAEGLMWRWWEQGGSAYRPCYWHRIGIPGSGGDQWFRADVEYVMCFKRPGPLPWSDNTAMGHPPKWAPGGEMSYRLTDGTKVNQWGPVSKKGRGRRANGKHKTGSSPSHVVTTKRSAAEKLALGGKRHTKRDAGRQADGDPLREQVYLPPALANPGCLISTGAAGGGRLGDWAAHENEAPFPEKLAEFFIRSLCPPGGTVLDPFCGSGTTLKVAKALSRNAIGCDIRTSQVALSKRRTKAVQRDLLEANQ